MTAYSFTAKLSDGASLTEPFTVRNILMPPAGMAWFGAYPASGDVGPTFYEPVGEVLNGSRELAVVTGYPRFDLVVSMLDSNEAWVGPGTGRTALLYQWPCLTNSNNTRGQNATAPSKNVYWTDIAAGIWDDVLTSTAEGLAEYGQPIFIRFSAEFDSTANDIEIFGNGDPRNYVPAYQHIYNIVAPLAPNVIWCWCPTGNNLTVAGSVGGTMSLEVMYPGDLYVDWICFDKYDFTLSYGSPLAAYSPFVNWIKAGNLAGNTGVGGHDYPPGTGTTKPRGLSETGVRTTLSATDSQIATWIDGVPSACAALGISMWCWFNASPEVLTLSGWPLSCAAMQNIGASEFFSA